MNEEQKKALEMVAGFFSGSVLETVIEAMMSDEHAPLTDDPVSQGDNIIGELSLLEKAIAAATIKLTNEHNALVEKTNTAAATDRENAREIMKGAAERIKYLSSAVKALHDLFWASIRFRLSNQGIKNLENIGTRSENEIVSLDDASHGDFHSFLRSMFESMEGGGHEHDCPNCPAYDACDLPIKQAAQG